MDHPDVRDGRVSEPHAAAPKITSAGRVLIPTNVPSFADLDKRITFKAKLKGMPASITCTFGPTVDTWDLTTSWDAGTNTLSAPDSLGPAVSQIEVKMTCSSGGVMADPVTITVALVHFESRTKWSRYWS